ncbi:MAG: hypothetical protein E6G36_12080 [Actinobacteria bacterium]|nr:MAG: hypothetical protein E6G36_12080 [Actinomycetota bacterium]
MLGVVGSAGADSTNSSGGANHVVIAQNTTDGAAVVHAGTQVVPTAGDTVTSANIAAAVNAGCVGCHSTAVAVQILIVHGSPSVFSPGNVAGAANGGCESCGAYAFARQHWIQVTGNSELSGAARAQVAQLRQEIADAASSILPSDVTTDPCVTTGDCPTRDEQLDATLGALADQLIQVVTNDLQASGATTSVLADRVEETAPGS